MIIATLFAQFPHVTIVPGFSEPIAIETVASQYCAMCGIKETPVWDGNNDEWIMPCHNFKCANCDWWYSIDNGYGTSTGIYCTDCYEPRDNRCNCEDCQNERRRNGGNYIVPQWERDGLTLSETYREKLSQIFPIVQENASAINPNRMMAEFYLSDYILARVNLQYRHGLSASNIGHRKAWELRADAKRVQDSVIASCDGIFRDYLLMAIGGEARHHFGVSMPSGRSSAWEWFVAMSAQYGRLYMIRAAAELFEDSRGWDSGYGGAAWGRIARILEARESGTMDSRTFVDRVFTLQHNGGSCLDKIDWGHGASKSHDFVYPGIGSMMTIGDAHAADVPNFTTIVKFSHADTVRDLLFDAEGFVRMSTSGMSNRERAEWDLAIYTAAMALQLEWVEGPPSCTGEWNQWGDYVSHNGNDCPVHPHGDGYHYRENLPACDIEWFRS